VTVDFGHNEVRLIYLALIPAARGRGYGKVVLQGVQRAAQQVASPVAVVVWRNNVEARRLYLGLGFRVEESQPVADRLVWYPSVALS
jgi:ribosomal protein S18 acetylase RimI-like enzyme